MKNFIKRAKINIFTPSASGYLTFIAAAFLSILLVIAVGFLSFIFNTRINANNTASVASAYYLAQAGVEKAIWSLNDDTNYTGEAATPLGGGEFTVSITDVDLNTKKITVTGFVPNASSSRRMERTVTVFASIDTETVSFSYAVQVGEGGFLFGNNTIINGNVYSNGIVDGSLNTQIRGDAYSAGPAGVIRDTLVTGSAHAHTIQNCTVQGNAYYQVKTSC